MGNTPPQNVSMDEEEEEETASALPLSEGDDDSWSQESPQTLEDDEGQVVPTGKDDSVYTGGLEDDEDDTSGGSSSLCQGWSFLLHKRPDLIEPISQSLKDDEENTTVWCASRTTTPSSNRMPLSKSWLSFASYTTTSVSSSSLQASSLNDPSNPDYYTPDEWQLSATQSVADWTQAPIWIVTTAALPWMTGTAVNPLLRACYLLEYRLKQQNEETSTDTTSNVHLVIPWLEQAEDRVALYGESWRQASQHDQETFIEEWCTTRNLHVPQIVFYPARYHVGLSSIFAMGDVLETCLQEQQPNKETTTTNDDDDDGNHNTTTTVIKPIVLLEEPEHLNYYRAPQTQHSLSQNFYCIGICHTNYKYYAQQHVTGLLTAPLVAAISAGLVRAHCHQIIKLSSVLQDYAPHKQVVMNVHGIRDEFLHVPSPTHEKIYFIGKLLWAKGLDQLWALQQEVYDATGAFFAMDIYGSGPEQEEMKWAFLGAKIKNSSDAKNPKEEDGNHTTTTAATTTSPWKTRARLARYGPLPVRFCGRKDHAEIGSEYKIFCNPSVSEVLCTTTAEALAMGKFVLLPQHASNDFFTQFPNALFYTSPREFAQRLHYAQHHAPEPLSDQLRHTLSWQAATERLFEAAFVSERDAARRERLYGKDDQRLAEWHYEWGRGRTGDVIRTVLGGGPVAQQVKYQQEQQRMQQQQLREQQQQREQLVPRREP